MMTKLNETTTPMTYCAKLFPTHVLPNWQKCVEEVNGFIARLIIEAGVESKNIKTTWMAPPECSLMCVVEWWRVGDGD
jgi:hypothetical protein